MATTFTASQAESIIDHLKFLKNQFIKQESLLEDHAAKIDSFFAVMQKIKGQQLVDSTAICELDSRSKKIEANVFQTNESVKIVLQILQENGQNEYGLCHSQDDNLQENAFMQDSASEIKIENANFEENLQEILDGNSTEVSQHVTATAIVDEGHDMQYPGSSEMDVCSGGIETTAHYEDEPSTSYATAADDSNSTSLFEPYIGPDIDMKIKMESNEQVEDVNTEERSHFGEAIYESTVNGMKRVAYQSTQPKFGGRVLIFWYSHAHHDKITVSYRCSQCRTLKEGTRGREFDGFGVPYIRVRNDIILDDPENPKSEHFCVPDWKPTAPPAIRGKSKGNEGSDLTLYEVFNKMKPNPKAKDLFGNIRVDDAHSVRLFQKEFIGPKLENSIASLCDHVMSSWLICHPGDHPPQFAWYGSVTDHVGRYSFVDKMVMQLRNFYGIKKDKASEKCVRNFLRLAFNCQRQKCIRLNLKTNAFQ